MRAQEGGINASERCVLMDNDIERKKECINPRTGQSKRRNFAGKKVLGESKNMTTLMNDLKPWRFVDKKNEGMNHRTEWCHELVRRMGKHGGNFNMVQKVFGIWETKIDNG